MLWLPWFGLTWLDASTWRRRLPFDLKGYGRVRGFYEHDENYTPYVLYIVTIEPRDETSDESAISRTLEILAHKVDRIMEADPQAQHPPKHHWRVEGNRVVGTADLRLYRTRILESWVRGPVRVLHRAVPLVRVRVESTYTGRSYMDLTGD